MYNTCSNHFIYNEYSGIKNRIYYELLLTTNDSVHLLSNNSENNNESDTKITTSSLDSGDTFDDDNEINNNQSNEYPNLIKSLDKNQKNFYIKLSSEHIGFIFEKNIQKAADMVQLHSSGHNSMALRLYATRAKHEKKKNKKYKKFV